ncbi:nucleosome/chromatin assembly factor group C [Iris pallida]|uniref:Nucleosome/chromatin assembly factor group C n=1 Tax=Iris pallida TaxID=29817 RepID=A0AAX6IB84_IRIPA|nr:nucleosome/chromatin assembly factor group C [Iris pallida]
MPAASFEFRRDPPLRRHRPRCHREPWSQVMKSHNDDTYCVDWNPHDVNITLTGSANNSVCLFDRQNLISCSIGSPLHNFKGQKAYVLCAGTKEGK